jgi:hypothetical protein
LCVSGQHHDHDGGAGHLSPDHPDNHSSHNAINGSDDNPAGHPVSNHATPVNHDDHDDHDDLVPDDLDRSDLIRADRGRPLTVGPAGLGRSCPEQGRYRFDALNPVFAGRPGRSLASVIPTGQTINGDGERHDDHRTRCSSDPDAFAHADEHHGGRQSARDLQLRGEAVPPGAAPGE